MIRGFALAAVLGVSLVAQPIAQRGGRQADVSVSSDTSLTQCWSPVDQIAAEDRAGCERHRDDVLTAWKTHGSYYALIEIVENALGDPEPRGERMRRDEVLGLLGTEHLEDYPNSRRDRFLAWSSDRALPVGSHLLVYFDKNDIVTTYDWVSE